jgi:Xaa-Pro dipeptidase
MEEHDLDCYVSFDPVNIYYLTNFANFVHERPFILVIGRTGTPTMFAPRLELSHVEARARCDLDYVTYDEFPAPAGGNWYDVYPDLIDSNARVGIEQMMPVGIADRTPGIRVVCDIIDEARIIKTDYEIGRTVHACSIVDLGHARLLELCRPDVLEGTIFSTAGGVMRQQIFADIPEANFIVTRTWAAVWPPSISHDPHRIPALSMPMEDGGPHVSIVSAQVDGYGVELERTFFLGMVPEHAAKPFQAMFAGRARAFEMLRPGQDMAEIDAAVRIVISEAGYGDCIIHRTGHGLGITGHEAPFIALGETRQLEPGMIVSVEPGIYRKDIGGYRHSDTVLITGEGYLNLTHAPETLDELVF